MINRTTPTHLLQLKSLHAYPERGRILGLLREDAPPPKPSCSPAIDYMSYRHDGLLAAMERPSLRRTTS